VARIDKTKSRGWYFPQYVRPGAGTSGYDIRREWRDMSDATNNYAATCYFGWNRDQIHVPGTCIEWDGVKCIGIRAIIPAGDLSVGGSNFKAWIPVNKVSSPYVNEIKIKNSEGLVVGGEAGADGTSFRNQICQSTFRGSTVPRKVIYEAVAGDVDGYTDIASVTMRMGTNQYPMAIVAGAGTTAIYQTEVTYSDATNDLTKLIEVNAQDTEGNNNNWSTEGGIKRYFRAWDCKINVSGNLYDGSDAPLGFPVCSSGGAGFTKTTNTAYTLTFNRISGGSSNSDGVYGGAIKSMNVTSPGYSSSTDKLTWGEKYSGELGGVAGVAKSMRVEGYSACQSDVDTAAIDAYGNDMDRTIDFSAVLDQESWYQVQGGGIRAGSKVQNSVPATCQIDNVLPCVPAMCKAEGANSEGIVAAPIISNDSSCGLSASCKYGDPNNWYIGKSLNKGNYGYEYWNSKISLLPSGKKIEGNKKWSEVVALNGGANTGVLVVHGDLEIDANNVLSGPKDYLIVVVSGLVVINPNVTNWQGVLIADGSITVGGNVADADQLALEGVVYSANSNVVITRSFADKGTNNDRPAVVIRYLPRLIFNLPPQIARIISGFGYN